MLSEDSYPVSTGGVSEWCEYLVKGMPECDFHILTIASSNKFKYEPPPNVKVSVFELAQPSFYMEKNNNCNVGKIIDILKPILEGKPIDCKKMYDFIQNSDVTAKELISSEQNRQAMMTYYKRHYSNKPFIPFFFSWTSLYYLLYKTLELVSQIPESDVLHSLNSGYAGILGAIGKVAHGSSLLINEHGIYLKERLFELEHSEVPIWLHGFYQEFFNALVKTSYSYSDEVISVCEDHINYLKNIYLNITPKVVYNGIDIGRYEFKYKNSNTPLTVGTVSRITPIKDQLTFIRSMPEVLEKHETKFYIIGDVQDEEYYDECLELVHTLGISQNVEFTGYQDSSEWYPMLDVFVLPSLSEGFPLTLLEALSSGTPCVATNVGGVPEVLDERFLVNKWDPSGLAQKINWLLEDEKTRNEIAQKGRTIVEKKYSIDQMVSNYNNIYEEMI
jgi:glycosyltransferase involved in cell wall biosynthesis